MVGAAVAWGGQAVPIVTTVKLARANDEWTALSRGPERDSRAALRSAGEPLSMLWQFAAAGAVPLEAPPLNGDLKTTAYTVGLPVGLSTALGLVLASSGSGFLYVLDARTGVQVWSHALWNMAMVNPIVSAGTVFATTGDPYYNFEQTLRFAGGERSTRGPGLNGVYALDLAMGAERWLVFTPG